jgi:hypothetical protein
MCLSAASAAPLPATDPCKHCLFFHPFQKDNIAYCKAENLCSIHDDAAASDALLKVDPLPRSPLSSSTRIWARQAAIQCNALQDVVLACA